MAVVGMRVDHEKADTEALRDEWDFNRVDDNDREDSKQNHGVRKSKVQLGIVLLYYCTIGHWKLGWKFGVIHVGSRGQVKVFKKGPIVTRAVEIILNQQ